MNLLTAVFIYVLIWWVVIFAILPLGVERHSEDGQGFDAGAPKRADMKKKLILTTIVSGVILGLIILLVDLHVIRWTEWFENGFKD